MTKGISRKAGAFIMQKNKGKGELNMDDKRERTVWIWFKSDETMEIKDVDFYSNEGDGFIRIKKINGMANILLDASSVKMLGYKDDIPIEEQTT